MRSLTPRAIWLQERMVAASATALRDVPGPDLDRLRAEIRSLRTILNGAGGASGAAINRVREAVDRFQETGSLPDARAARLVSWGTTLRTRSGGALIEDAERFRPMMDAIDGFRSDRRPFRRCWRGLLDGYIRYDPDDAPETGRSNWRALRDYLNDNLPGLERRGHPPDWLSTIDDHANILTDDPCGRYGADLLERNGEVLESLRRELSAGDSSWIGRRLFGAQIAAAVGFDDGRLRGVLPQVLVLIDEHPLLGDDALARVLDRYAASSSPNPEADLRDASVARWGNPWLERNDTRWTLVRPDTRRMVSSWLKLRLIEEFFGLLSEDGINDQRRIAFWKRHVDHISDMHFALGEAAYRDPRPDFRALRQAMKGRLLRLEGGGARNNAFIMRIGDHVFVEFGEKGNAMFAFDARTLPFDLLRSYVSGDKTALKHPSHVARMVHMDGRAERWEAKLDRRIAELARRSNDGAARVAAAVTAPSPLAAPRGAPPASGPAPFLNAPSAVPPPMRQPESITSTPAPVPEQTRSTGDLTSFLLANRIKTIDLRDKGGSLWASVPQAGDMAAELRRRGFAWSDRRSAWYLKQ